MRMNFSGMLAVTTGRSGVPENSAVEKSAGFGSAYAEIATDRGIPFLNAGDYASCPVPDTIHIDAEGCSHLGKAVAQKVKEIFS